VITTISSTRVKAATPPIIPLHEGDELHCAILGLVAFPSFVWERGRVRVGWGGKRGTSMGEFWEKVFLHFNCPGIESGMTLFWPEFTLNLFHVSEWHRLVAPSFPRMSSSDLFRGSGEKELRIGVWKLEWYKSFSFQLLTLSFKIPPPLTFIDVFHNLESVKLYHFLMNIVYYFFIFSQIKFICINLYVLNKFLWNIEKKQK
jgi:hypothetical protein